MCHVDLVLYIVLSLHARITNHYSYLYGYMLLYPYDLFYSTSTKADSKKLPLLECTGGLGNNSWSTYVLIGSSHSMS